MLQRIKPLLIRYESCYNSKGWIEMVQYWNEGEVVHEDDAFPDGRAFKPGQDIVLDYRRYRVIKSDSQNFWMQPDWCVRAILDNNKPITKGVRAHRDYDYRFCYHENNRDCALTGLPCIICNSGWGCTKFTPRPKIRR